MKKKILIELQFLPCINYLRLLKSFEEVFFEKHESFQKQSYRNRYSILTANGGLSLTVPVKKSNRHSPIQEVTIDYSENWVAKHWTAIKSAYANAPYWEYYSDGLHNILCSKEEKLFSLSIQLLTFCLKSTKIELQSQFSKSFQKIPDKGIYDAREIIHPKKPLESVDMSLPNTYYQVFGNEFVNNMSIIDLLFNEGPNSLSCITPYKLSLL